MKRDGPLEAVPPQVPEVLSPARNTTSMTDRAPAWRERGRAALEQACAPPVAARSAEGAVDRQILTLLRPEGAPFAATHP